jgi:hypothetical protein
MLCSTAIVTLAAFPAIAGDAPAFLDDFHSIDVSVQGGYVMGSGDLPYAQFFDGAKDFAFKVGPGNGWNGKIGATAHFDSGWSFGANYAYLHSTASAATASFDRSNTQADWPVWNILGFQNNSNPSGATSYNSATVSTGVHTDIVDLTAGRDIGLGDDANVFVKGGLRLGEFEQQTNMDLFCSRPPGSIGPGGCATRTLEVAEHRGSRFAGVGPEVGADYRAPLAGTGLGLFGSWLTSALFGHQKTITHSMWEQGLPHPTLRTYSHDRVAFTLDADAGVSYAMSDFPLLISAGYQVSWLAHVRDSKNEAIATGSTNSFGSRKADLLYHGPFLRLSYTP